MKSESLTSVVVAVAVTLVMLYLLRPTPPVPVQPQPQEKVQLYLFTQDGCAPCKQLHRSLQDPAVQKLLAEKFAFQVVKWPSDLFKTYHVDSTPTLVAVTKDGPKSKSGPLSPVKLLEWLSSL